MDTQKIPGVMESEGGEMTGGVPTIGEVSVGKLHTGIKPKHIDGSSPRTTTHVVAAATKVGEGARFSSQGKRKSQETIHHQ